MGKHILEEAQRCLQCKKPLCQMGCPVKTPINKMIEMLLNGQIQDAGEMLFQNNPLSIICAMVCPHEHQCEGHCVLGKKGKPVHISTIEHYISEYYLDMHNIASPRDPEKKVAIIGSGPAGITIAFILANRGYDITIFEAYDKIGGVLRYGIPEFRLPKQFLERMKVKLLEWGVKIRPNTLIGKNLTIDNLFRDGYKAVFIGTGTWKPRTLDIVGESLGHVHYAIDYLKNPDVYNLGKTVSIIGAGNVAMDVARTALRKGSTDVSIIYRMSEDTMTARKYEVDYARLEGVKFNFHKSPIKIVDHGIICCETDEEGNAIANTEHLVEADSIIISISQGPQTNIISTAKDIEVKESGLVKVDQQGNTTQEGVFASGDVVTGAKSVVEAVRVSKNVADAIDEYVQKKYFGK